MTIKKPLTLSHQRLSITAFAEPVIIETPVRGKCQMARARRKPSAPETPSERKRREEQAEKTSRAHPEQWGVNSQQAKLAAFSDVGEARTFFKTDDNVVYTTLARQPVFMSLAKCSRPLISINEAIAGQALAEIYARSKGMAGLSDHSTPEVMTKEFGPRLLITDGKIDNGRRYMHLCASIPEGDHRIAIQALCVAITEAHGAIEWRGVVQMATKERNPANQAYIVRKALEALSKAFDREVEGEWRRGTDEQIRTISGI